MGFYLLKAPQFSDEARTRAAAILNGVLLTTLLGLLLGAIPITITSGEPGFTGGLFAGAALIMLILLLLARRGYIQLASLLLVSGLWVIFQAVNLVFGGQSLSALAASVMVVVVAGLLLGTRGALTVAILSALSVGLITAGYLNNVLSPVFAEGNRVNHAVGLAAVYALTALYLYLSTNRLNEALRRARTNADIARDTLDELRATTVSRDYVDNIIRSMSNLLIVLDADGTIRTVNPALSTLLRCDEDQIVGRSFAQIAPDGPQISHLLAQREGRAIELSLLTPTQRRIPVMLSSAVMLRDGRLEGVVCVAEDVSTQRQAEEQRKRDQLRYRALFEQTTDAVFILDLDGTHLAVNQRAADMLGYTPDELLTLTYKDLVTREELLQTETTMRALTGGERVPLHERIFRRKDGTEFPVEVSAQLVRDDAGQPIHIQRIVRDITDRKQAEEQLVYQAELLENVSDAIISTRLDSTIRTWNKAAEQVYGWRADEAIGQPLTEIVPTIYTDRSSEEVIKRQYFARGYWRSEVMQKRRDGTLLQVLSSVSVMRDSGGRALGTVAVNHDITKRKQAELELQKRLDQLDTLRQVDAEIGSTLDLNKVLLFGLNAAVGMAGADAGFIAVIEDDGARLVHRYGAYHAVEVPEGTRPNQHFGVVGRALRMMQPILVTDVTTDPDYVPEIAETQALMAIPLLSHERMVGVINLETAQTDHFTDEVFAFVKLVAGRLASAIDNARLYDISQRQVAELHALYTEIKALEQLKTDMIRIASHDLRNPIGIINGYLELLRMDVYERLSPAEIDYVEIIAKQIDRMQNLIRDLLSLERIHKLAKEQLTETVDLNTLVDQLVRNHRAEADHKAQSLEITPAAPGTLVVLGDSKLLYEAISNLITNAIKYTPNGGSVRVALERVNGSARVAVTDTGYGIPAEFLPNLFQPFYRVKMQETSGIDGTGLGLSLVKNIVERHAGQIHVESEYGKGSRFWVDLPLMRETEAA